jgi:hypothetical protein
MALVGRTVKLNLAELTSDVGRRMAHDGAMSNTKCLNPNCRRPAHVRGLCAVCYVRANEVIKKGLSTWEKLEAAHKIMPSKRQKIFTRKWLLDKVG